jgi:hypothetical protein
MTQVVEHLLCKHKALSTNSIPTNKKQKLINKQTSKKTKPNTKPDFTPVGNENRDKKTQQEGILDYSL